MTYFLVTFLNIQYRVYLDVFSCIDFKNYNNNIYFLLLLIIIIVITSTTKIKEINRLIHESYYNNYLFILNRQ